jgi:hypothetical protein
VSVTAPSTCRTKSAGGKTLGSRPPRFRPAFVGHSGLCTQISRQQVGVLLLMFKAQRQVRLRRDAVELV